MGEGEEKLCASSLLCLASTIMIFVAALGQLGSALIVRVESWWLYQRLDSVYQPYGASHGIFTFLSVGGPVLSLRYAGIALILKPGERAKCAY